MVIAGIVVVPKLFSDKTVSNSTNNGGKSPDDNLPPTTDPNEIYIREVQSLINAGTFDKAVEQLSRSSSSFPPNEKEALQKRLREAFLHYLDTRVESQAYGSAFDELKSVRSGVGLSAEDKQTSQEKIRTAWLTQALDELASTRPRRLSKP